MGIFTGEASLSEQVQKSHRMHKDEHNHKSHFTQHSSHRALNGKSNLCSLIPLSKQTKYRKAGISMIF